MKKTIGAIVSILKPVDDTRMYEKMAQSLINTGKFSVNILGFSSNTHSLSSDIIFHPIFRFKPHQIDRLRANWVVFLRLRKIKPDFIIVNTPELTPAILLIKSISPTTRLFYDMRENHARNLLNHYEGKRILRKWLAKLIDYFEKQLSNQSERLFIAEKGYFKEKLWLHRKSTVLLENKVITHNLARRPANHSHFKLLYTGTISTVYGIWDAIRFAEGLHSAMNNKLEFILVGHVTQNDTFQQLVEVLPTKPWIQPIIGVQPIPHQQILDVIFQADFGIVSHQILPSIENCFPTRIWEYMNYLLPFFLQHHEPWVEYCQPWHCALPINFSQQNWPMNEIVERINNNTFYPDGKPDNIYWEEGEFLSAMEFSLGANL